MDSVGIVIPVYKPDKKLDQLLEQLYIQTVLPKEICLMLTLVTEDEQRERDELETRVKKAREAADIRLEAAKRPRKSEPEVKIISFPKSEFNHGKTREEGIRACDTDYVVCMTMDAVPKDGALIFELLDALKRHPGATQSYARQMTDKYADALTKLTQDYNYPNKELVKDKSCYQTLGIKTIFCSDVCCMYRKDVFLALGGFEQHVIFNEDMMFARKTVDAGNQIVYAANARVIHWHNYNMSQQFHRNFDNGVSQAEHPEVFADLPAEGEGMKMVKKNLVLLLKKGKVISAGRYVFQCAAKLLGFRLGKRYQKLPKKLVLKCTMTPSYFR